MTTPRRGRPPVLTDESVGAAVLEVGFVDLTFAAVRERLGVGESTLYRYAGDRDALVRIGLDAAISATDWPALTGDWRGVLHRYALTAWRAWAAYPGSATEAARGIVPAGTLRLMDEICGVLVEQGFTPQNAVLACDLVFDLVTDNRRGVEHIDALVPSASSTRETLSLLWRDGAAQGGEPTERNAIHSAILAAVEADPLDWFTAKLAVVLDGIERALAP